MPTYTKRFRAEIFAINAIDISKNIEKIRVVLNNNDKKIIGIKILSALSPITGKEIPASNSNKIAPNTYIDAEITLNSTYPMEKFSTFENLGRFIIFVGDKFSGIGRIK
jgi:translation elongation factor EF-1alpha